MTDLQFHQFTSRSDNYCVLVHSPGTGETVSIDVPEAAPVDAALSEKGWNLTHIFITHHHGDHVEGVAELKRKYGAQVTGPDNPKIEDIDIHVTGGNSFEFGGSSVDVIATPGHTLDMLNYHFPEQKVVFTGDTLFAMGCGRLFEGDAEMMWESLEKLMQLPADTAIYCGHEYTLANGKFALTVDGNNEKLKARVAEVEKLRQAGKPTLPTTLELELETNPFLRARDDGIRANLGMEDASAAEVFAEIRARKDRS